MRLTSGLAVDVKVERIGATGGALFELAPLGETRAPVPRLRKRGGLLAAQVHRDLRAHATARARVLIAGEQGTGRTSAVRLLAADIATVDAADLPATGEQAWCARLADVAAHHLGLVAVEGVHLLPDPVAAWLCRLLDTSPAWFAHRRAAAHRRADRTGRPVRGHRRAAAAAGASRRTGRPGPRDDRPAPARPRPAADPERAARSLHPAVAGKPA